LSTLLLPELSITPTPVIRIRIEDKNENLRIKGIPFFLAMRSCYQKQSTTIKYGEFLEVAGVKYDCLTSYNKLIYSSPNETTSFSNQIKFIAAPTETWAFLCKEGINMGEILVFDIDECLVNSVEKHYRLLKQWARENGHAEVESLSYDEFCAGGGTKHFENIWPDYNAYCESNRKDANFNRGLVEVPGSRNAQRLLDSEAHAYLTTRPEEMIDLTYEELVLILNFLDLKIIARPSDVPITQTTEWKLSKLQEMVENTGTPKIMLDDQVSMHDAVKSAHNPWIESILIKGDRTPEGHGALRWQEVPSEVLSIMAVFSSRRRE
jgi:hypothetical protein